MERVESRKVVHYKLSFLGLTGPSVSLSFQGTGLVGQWLCASPRMNWPWVLFLALGSISTVVITTTLVFSVNYFCFQNNLHEILLAGSTLWLHVPLILYTFEYFSDNTQRSQNREYHLTYSEDVIISQFMSLILCVCVGVLYVSFQI